ncbi:hypothetical protein ADL22_20635 [Streptomyces sp. NRRL F-4489]|uniref:hypothetical protein n=1 Tax=Streptomyces sp. NRRL F-4489 TaxID=1609095 RepID=UPI000748DEAB|nr:hypothetical protein [Streptomyces sp. NRRL F-4489]KUL37793.1 hypothetical protein ADL22_20635 [Streptomyces sp. NRRL F-4489]
MPDHRARGGRRWRAARAAGRAAPLLALLVQLTGCAPAESATDRYPGVQKMLDERAGAVRRHDTAAFLATVDPRATAFRDRQRAVLGNLAAVPLADWRYDLVSTGAFALPAGGGRRLAAQVRLRYRLSGYDTAPVTSVQYLTLTERGGRWLVSADTDGAADGKTGTRQLWDQGPVRLVRARYGLVLGGAADPDRLRDLARRVDAAVPAVSAVWKGAWARKVVVEAPDTVERMAQLMGGDDPSAYGGIAAVTTGEAGAGAAAPADRVIVNPDAYEELNDLGRTVVLTHETTHVATRAVTTPATPLWLSEGFADWVAYREVRRRPATTAPELSRAVAAGGPPARLPADADFGFRGGAERLAEAYEGGWLACRMIAERWGEARLIAFYRDTGRRGPHGAAAGPATGPMEARTAAPAPSATGTAAPDGGTVRAAGRGGPVERAMRAQLGVGMAEFTAMWRAYVRRELG